MDPLLAHALADNHGVFSAAHARSAGFDRHAIGAQVRTGAWRQVRYGVYTTRASWERHAADDELHRLAAAAVLLRLRRDGTVLSHGTAARLHGLVLPAGVATDVELTDPEQFRSGRGYHVRRASLPADDVTEVGGLPVTSLARTLADVGREWDVVDTVVAADDLLADARLTEADLRATALRHAHWPRTGRMAHALGLARVGAHSPHETRTRLQIVAAGLPQPMLQAAVRRLDGRVIGIVDMLWLLLGVFGECDGRVKTTDPWNGRAPAEAVWREKCRHDDLVDVDLRGIRFKPADLFAVWPQKLARLRHLLDGPSPERLLFQAEQWNGGLRSQPRHVARAAQHLAQQSPSWFTGTGEPGRTSIN